MEIEFDPEKRIKTLAERGLDMARVGEIFERTHVTYPDDRFDYGEPRYITVGVLDGRMVVMVWTQRDGLVRVISLRKANEREQNKHHRDLG